MTRQRRPQRRRLLAPEVVQTSAMDCGPATLKCLLEGFRVPVSYGRLREACQTDVDGTSIDTLEEVACQLGLDAEQQILPPDHLLMAGSASLPALVVILLPGGITHFIVVWSVQGPLVQVMDPATGRRWISRQELLDQLYLHEMEVPARQWREWAGSDSFTRLLRRRLDRLGVDGVVAEALIRDATEDVGWRSLARLDAAVRTTASIVDSGGLRGGDEAARVLETLVSSRIGPQSGRPEVLPDESWSVRPGSVSGDGNEQVLVRGAVLVRVKRRRSETQETGTARSGDAPLPPELVAALEEPPARPGLALLKLLRDEGVLTPAVLACALVLAAGGVLLEALLFRGVLQLSADLELSGQRLAAMGALLLFLSALLLLDLPVTTGLLRYGRKLELRLRVAFLSKIPRLRDRYFRSRLNSDMAERSHSLHQIRLLPQLGGQFLQAAFGLVFTAAGIAWLDPASAPLACLAAVAALGIPLLAQPMLFERDLRVRTHGGGLTRFYIDALFGLVTLRAHGAERSQRRAHEERLGEWARAGFGLQRAAVAVEALQTCVGFGLAAWLLFRHLERGGDLGAVLLLVYWALHLPVLGQEVGLMAQQYPEMRNLILRLLEPLGAGEEQPDPGPAASGSPHGSAPGVCIAMQDLAVRAAGHTILEGINLHVPAGEHLAIVGPSGAGKTTLVGTLLGWHVPADGSVLVDGVSLDGPHLEQIRRHTAWVDPAVELWNRPMLENLQYGGPQDAGTRVGEIIRGANLEQIVERLPDGLQSVLGEGGALVSGGEGQRVRLGRAMLRRDSRLVILDEPFRGLDREQRGALLRRARLWWKQATLICITHDVGETQSFGRVLVVEDGGIVEDGDPRALAARPDSRYRAMLEAEHAVRGGLSSAEAWRRVGLDEGRLHDVGEIAWLR